MMAVVLSVVVVGCNDNTAPEEKVTVATPNHLIGTAVTFQQITAALSHTCGRSTAGLLYCWGTGELGNGIRTAKKRPTAVAGGLQYRSVSARWWRTCAIATDYHAYCWGS